ncbi:hypothetical protein A8B75_10135 [Sphingomonadales bacterium EhC05]|nr:hypothetical protein A8B75_10135 [Sphingomonadales bacterium EhC05]
MVLSARQTEILADAEYLAHRYDEVADGFRFVHVPRDVHRSSTFITDEHLPNVDQFELISRGELAPSLDQLVPVHFIFHSAYCCSTMMARAFDIPGTSMGLKEPMVLNDMIGWKRRGASEAMVSDVLDRSLDLLARPFDGDQAVIIKPSNICTPLAIPALRQRPDAKALLLYAPIDSYLKSISKKEMWGRIWVRDVLLGTLKDGYLIGGFSQEQLLQLTDLQVAAVGWLSQHAAFAKILDTIGSDRVKLLDSETFLARPDEAIDQLNEFFDLGLSQEKLDQIISGPAFTSHSKLDQNKPDVVFDAAKREQEQSQTAALHGAEIDMVVPWIKAVAESQNIRIDIGSNLLS